ncbi:MAG: hypothetical protein R3304_07220 [Longimicrobiales bacterium]|nr:hypothetical protein [Longimicrobiales bacterium]
MNWDAVGAVAEMVGAVGVIATLIYLAMQVRHNTRAVRAQTYDSFVSQFRNWNEPMRAHEEMAERFHELMEDVESLSPREQRHAVHVLYDFTRLAENLLYQHREGMLSDAVWSGWENTFRAYLSAPGFSWYLEKRRSFFAPEFNEWVRTLQETAGVADPRASAITRSKEAP